MRTLLELYIYISIFQEISSESAEEPEPPDPEDEYLNKISQGLKYRKCSQTQWSELQLKFESEMLQVINAYCQIHTAQCFGEQQNFTYTPFDRNSLIVLSPTQSSNSYCRSHVVPINPFQTTIHVKLVVFYPNTGDAIEKLSLGYTDTLAKRALHDILQSSRQQLESALKIVFTWIEPFKKETTWVEAWFWPLSILLLLVAVISLKAGFYMAEKKSMINRNILRMDKDAENKAKKRYIVDMLNRKYQNQEARKLVEQQQKKKETSVVLQINHNGGPTEIEELDCQQQQQSTSAHRYKVEILEVPTNGDGTLPNVTVTTEESQVELPPMGSNAYYFMISELMADKAIDRQMRELNAEHLEGQHLQPSQRRSSVWKQIFPSPGVKRHSQQQSQPKNYKRANMFMLLLGGKRKGKVANADVRTRL